MVVRNGRGSRNLREIFEPIQRRSRQRQLTRKENGHLNRIDRNIQLIKQTLQPVTQAFQPLVNSLLESYSSGGSSGGGKTDVGMVYLWKRVTVYKHGPEMDRTWWIGNCMLLLIPIGLLAICLEYQTRQMHETLGNMENGDKTRILGHDHTSTGERAYYYDYDEALIRLEYDANKSDVQKRTERKMILSWQEKELHDKHTNTTTHDQNDAITNIQTQIMEYMDRYYHSLHHWWSDSTPQLPNPNPPIIKSKDEIPSSTSYSSWWNRFASPYYSSSAKDKKETLTKEDDN